MRIQLSKKHGVNPAVSMCFFCNEESNMLILAGRMKNDAEAPSNMVWNMEPCNTCAGYMEQGILLISVRDGEMEKQERELELYNADFERTNGWRSDKWKRRRYHFMPSPYRTGGWLVLKREAFKRMFNGDAADNILRTGWGFVPDEVWNTIGLPRGDVNE